MCESYILIKLFLCETFRKLDYYGTTLVESVKYNFALKSQEKYIARVLYF